MLIQRYEVKILRSGEKVLFDLDGLPIALLHMSEQRARHLARVLTLHAYNNAAEGAEADLTSLERDGVPPR